jgi:hypothetical protein
MVRASHRRSRLSSSRGRGAGREHFGTGHRPHGVRTRLRVGAQLVRRQHVDDRPDGFPTQSVRRVQDRRDSRIVRGRFSLCGLHGLRHFLNLAGQSGHDLHLAYRVGLPSNGANAGRSWTSTSWSSPATARWTPH